MYIYYVTMPEQISNDELAVTFSSNLIGTLRSIVRSHNKDNPDYKVNFNQLKEVYINAADNYNYAGYSRGHWALARVNMFLRVSCGEIPEYIKSKETKELGGLKFEAKIIASKEEHDISRNWIPSQEDFTKSLNQIKNNKLTYDFASVKELYLEDYQPIQLKAY